MIILDIIEKNLTKHHTDAKQSDIFLDCALHITQYSIQTKTNCHLKKVFLIYLKFIVTQSSSCSKSKPYGCSKTCGPDLQ